MRTGTKISLFTSGLYAASALALPAYANVTQEKPKEFPVEAINVENIETTQEANQMFNEKLRQYCSDRFLNSKEIRNLHEILVKEGQLYEQESTSAMNKSLYYQSELNDIQKKRTHFEKKLKSLGEYNTQFRNYLSEQRKKIEELLEEEYPGIIKKEDIKLNIIHPSNIRIERGDFNVLIRETIQVVHNNINIEYNDNTLELLTEGHEFILRDVAKLLRLMENYEIKLEGSNDNMEEREKLKKEIESLNQKEKETYQELIKEKKIQESFSGERDISRRKKTFKKYIEYKDTAKEFVERFEDLNNYWSYSLIKFLYYSDNGIDSYLSSLSEDEKNIAEDVLKQYLNHEGLEAEIEGLKRPTKLRFPFWWWIPVNGFAIPMIRNVLIRLYLKPEDDWGYGGSLGAALGNGALGTLITDGLHPLAFWARLATPLLIQPLKKSGWFDDF